MSYILRDPIGPVERQMLKTAIRWLDEFPGVRFVNFVLPPPASASLDDLRPETLPSNKGVTVYTIDRSPVGDLWGREVLVITVGKIPFMLFSPYHGKIAEKKK